MVLPFSNESKAKWNVFENLERIDWAVQESNIQHFEQELRALYPRLQKYGLNMPMIDPVSIGNHEYDSTWKGFHLTFLKVLLRWIRYNHVNVRQWNLDVDRENSKRKSFAEQCASFRNSEG